MMDMVGTCKYVFRTLLCGCMCRSLAKWSNQPYVQRTRAPARSHTLFNSNFSFWRRLKPFRMNDNNNNNSEWIISIREKWQITPHAYHIYYFRLWNVKCVEMRTRPCAYDAVYTYMCTTYNAIRHNEHIIYRTYCTIYVVTKRGTMKYYNDTYVM